MFRPVAAAVALLTALWLVWGCMPKTEPEISDETAIEGGATGGDLRYWRAKEAVRQGEARLTAQAAIRTALEARATALTGWAAVGLLAAAGAAFAAKDATGVAGAIFAGVVLFGAAATGIHAVRPRNWSMVGYDPEVIITDRLGSELELLESIAGGLSPGIQANNLRLDGMGRRLRWAGWLLIAAPLVGGLAYWKVPTLIAYAAAVLQRFPRGLV
jgi:hypothetical protein